MNGLITLSAVALSAAMLMPLSAQAVVGDPTSIPTDESAVRVGSLHDADKPKTDKPKTDKAADRAADSASAATASKPLVSTGVAIAGAVVGIVLLAAIGIVLAMASRRK